MSKKNGYRFNIGKAIIFAYICLIPYCDLVLSYFNVDIFSSLSFSRQDGWCNFGQSDGVGVHCFGDFNEGMTYSRLGNKVETVNKIWLTPIDFYISKISTALGGIIGTRNTLLAFLILYVVFLYQPIKNFKNSISNKQAGWVIGFLFFGSAPVIFALDRMNSICLLVPVIYYLSKSLLNRKLKSTAAWITIAIIIKPQMIILFILLPSQFGVFPALVTILIAGIVFLVSLTFSGSFSIEHIQSFINVLTKYNSDYQSIKSDLPSNYSFGRTLYYVFSRFSFIQLSETEYQYISIFLSSLLILMLVLRWSKNPQINEIQGILILACLGFPRLVHGYYLLPFLILEIAKYSENLNQQDLKLSEVEPTNFLNFVRRVAIFLILLPIPIPILGLFEFQLRDSSRFSAIAILNPILINIALFLYLFILAFTRKSLVERNVEAPSI